MSFKNIQLPGVVLSALYKDLVVADEKASPNGVFEKPNPGVKRAGISNQNKEIEQAPDTKGTEKQSPGKVEKSALKNPETSAYKILGNNQRKVTVIVNYPQEAFIPEEDLQVLTKMLGACKLNLGDIALINNATLTAEIEKIKDQLQPEKVLLFGVSPSEIGLPISFPEYKQQNYAGTVFVSAPSITRMNGETDENKLIKRKLWQCLKPLFT